MFLKRDYRASAVGALAALAVLFTGVVATGAVTPAPAPAVVYDTPPSLVRPETRHADDCARDLRCRSEIVC